MIKTNHDIFTDTSNILGEPYKTILYNDSSHDMFEVTAQIIKAIKCDAVKATELMMEAHNTGSAIVFTGGRERCELVASILEEIQLATKVEKA